jgi:hypothetical protein
MAEEVNYKVAEDFKATVKLFSGKEVTIDITKIDISEWKKAVRPNTPDEEEYKIIAKSLGVSEEELIKFSQPDYRLIIDAFVRVGTQPLTNPT